MVLSSSKIDPATSTLGVVVESHHLGVSEKLKFSNITAVAQGRLFASVRTEVKYGHSTTVIAIPLSTTTAAVRDDLHSYFNFEMSVDWRQLHEFLQLQFPLNIHSQTASREMAFGQV